MVTLFVTTFPRLEARFGQPVSLEGLRWRFRVFGKSSSLDPKLEPPIFFFQNMELMGINNGIFGIFGITFDRYFW